MLVQIFLVCLFRLSFAGRVCSGDYLSSRERDIQLHNSNAQPVYLIAEGRNLLAIIICELVLIPLVFLAIKIRRPHLNRIKELERLEKEYLQNQ